MLETGQDVGAYKVLNRVGAGATADVYRVRHARLKSEFALKVLQPRGPSDIRRLENEGQVQSNLHHPNIVHVVDVLEVGTSIGLVLEFVDGPDLATWLESHTPDLKQGLDLFDGIVRGVQHAHDAGLVHRDLKPANVLLQRVREGLIPKVSDFGIAKIFGTDSSPGQTMQGVAMGTPRYMAPEQFTDAASVDQRADLFSLGCILYELTTGAPAFTPINLFDAHDSARSAAYAPLPESLPANVTAAIKGCLEPQRDKRIGDCQTLLQILGRPTHASAAATPVKLSATIPPPRTTGLTTAPPERSNTSQTLVSLQGDETLAPPKGLASGPVDTSAEPPPRAPSMPSDTMTSPRPAATRPPVALIVSGVILLAIASLAILKSVATPESLPLPIPVEAATTRGPDAPVEVQPTELAVELPIELPTQVAPDPSPAEPVVAPAPVAPAPMAPKRKDPVKVAAVVAPPPETTPVTAAATGPKVESALVAVPDAEELRVVCGSVAVSGTTTAKPRKFPAGPCEIQARINGQWLSTTVEVTTAREIRCLDRSGSLFCE